MPISFLPVTTSGKIEEEGAIIECRNRNPQKRSRYKVYLADKSVPVPKVSLWRMTKEENTYDERNEASFPRDRVRRCSSEIHRFVSPASISRQPGLFYLM